MKRTFTIPSPHQNLDSIADKTVSVYYKIPYAEPPTGDLRFRPPRPAQPWNDTLDVSDSKPDSCYQARDEMFPDFA